MFPESPAGLRQMDMVLIALKQTRANLFLQRLDLNTQGRLRYVQFLSRPTEPQLVGHGEEKLQLPQLHDREILSPTA
jgi:hypothetical protein